MHNIHSYTQTLACKGSLQYIIDGVWTVDVSKNKYGTMLNSQTIEHAHPSALPGCKRILTIENQANYEGMEYADDTLYIYCHGYFSPKEVNFIREIIEFVGEECEYFHWGDMDYGGISIFLFIKERVFPGLCPYKMSVTDFDDAVRAGAWITLEASAREKLKNKDAGILSELKNRILETNKTIEQEQLK